MLYKRKLISNLWTLIRKKLPGSCGLCNLFDQFLSPKCLGHYVRIFGGFGDGLVSIDLHDICLNLQRTLYYDEEKKGNN